MRRYGIRPGKPFEAADWQKSWAIRGPQPMTRIRLERRNELEAFRLVLARKEPKS